MYFKMSDKDINKNWRTLRAVNACGVVFCIIGIAVMVNKIRDDYKTEKWPTAPGVIQEIYPEGDGKKIYIRYAYSANGQAYTGSQIALDGNGRGDKTAAQNYADTHPVGAPVTVYYDPSKESNAILEVGLQKLHLITGIAFCVVLAVCLYGVWHYRKAPPGAAPTSAPPDHSA